MLGIAVFGLVFIVVAVCAVAALSGAGRGTAEIALPEPMTDSSADIPPDGSAHGLQAVEITADNVQDVVATLARPEAYSRSIMVENFWDGGNSVHNFSVAVTAGTTALRTSVGGKEKNIVVTEEGPYMRTYIWYSGDSRVFESSAEGGAGADEYQMILTYEDILKLPRSAIINAGFAGGGGTELYATYKSGELGYLTECRVSMSLGLLTSAEIYDGETLIYRMTAGECRVGEPDDIMMPPTSRAGN
jgi:hypothetical protein